MTGARGRRLVLACATGILAVGLSAVLPGSPASAATTGKVGSYAFSTGTAKGASATCTITSGKLTMITVKAPKAQMRLTWAQPHNGAVALGQYVDFVATLQGEKNGKWVTLASKHKSTLVKKTLTQLPALPAFTTKSGIKSGYSAYHVAEKLRWLRPSDNKQEGTASVALTHYKQSGKWRSACTARTSTPPPTKHAPPGAPTDGQCGTSGNTVTFSWTAGATHGLAVHYALSSGGTSNPADWSPTPATTTATRYSETFYQDYYWHTLEVQAVDSQGQVSVSKLSIQCYDNRPGAPAAVSNLNCSLSGTNITWTWRNPTPPNGDVAYHVSLSGATSVSNDGLATSWSHDWGQDGASHTLTVTVLDNGRQSSSAQSKACSEPSSSSAPPTVTVSEGPACGSYNCNLSNGACTSSACHFVDVTLANFSGTVSCSITGASPHGTGGFVSWSQGNGTKQTVDAEGWKGEVITVTCGGVSSSPYTWPG